MPSESELVEKLKELVQSGRPSNNESEAVERLRGMNDFLQELRDQYRSDFSEYEMGREDPGLAQKKRELEHAERMRALELGQPLPDETEMAKFRSAARAAGAIGVLVPLALILGASAASFLLFYLGPETAGTVGSMPPVFGSAFDFHFAALGLIWGIAGFLTLVTVWFAFRTLRRVAQASKSERLPGRGGVSTEGR